MESSKKKKTNYFTQPNLCKLITKKNKKRTFSLKSIASYSIIPQKQEKKRITLHKQSATTDKSTIASSSLVFYSR